jgi:hypothetical protein
MDIKNQIDEVLKSYQGLKYDSDSNSFAGKICVASNDCYEVIIDLKTYPDNFPIVYEIGERIPQVMDRHKYSNSDGCCFTTFAKAQVLLKTKIFSLLEFLKEIVIPYFKSNSFYEINKYYPNSTYSHGVDGVIEGYKDILVLPLKANEILIQTILLNRLQGKILTIRDKCYCGSGDKLKRCYNGKHDVAYRNFKKIDSSILLNDLQQITKRIEVFKKLVDQVV